MPIMKTDGLKVVVTFESITRFAGYGIPGVFIEKTQKRILRSEMDENTIKVLARFTETGQNFPSGAWICYESDRGSGLYDRWHKIISRSFRRDPGELSESEANSMGIYRNKDVYPD
jgi:hypothetical protein